MTDIFSKKKRSAIMAAVKATNTRPERAIQKLFKTLGLKPVLHSRKLTGSPDLALVDRRIAIFVHGCFWHGHEHCRKSQLPKTNRAYWKRKISLNMRRDARQIRLLRKEGWKTIVIWTCKRTDASTLRQRLRRLGVTFPSE